MRDIPTRLLRTFVNYNCKKFYNVKTFNLHKFCENRLTALKMFPSVPKTGSGPSWRTQPITLGTGCGECHSGSITPTRYKVSRVTRKLSKNLPNIWKCSQNCSQNAKALLESPKHLHPTAFNVKISTTSHVLKLLILLRM